MIKRLLALPEHFLCLKQTTLMNHSVTLSAICVTSTANVGFFPTGLQLLLLNAMFTMFAIF
jgi:hypothetical protein